jgi:hypothetical protein
VIRTVPLLAALLVGCAPPCLDDLDAACAPLYEPTWDNVYERTLVGSCSSGGSTCHSAQGAQGDFATGDQDATYARLLGTDGSAPLLEADDAACSLLVRVVRSTDVNEQMPPGSPLSDAEACAIQQWVDGGAAR